MNNVLNVLKATSQMVQLYFGKYPNGEEDESSHSHESLEVYKLWVQIFQKTFNLKKFVLLNFLKRTTTKMKRSKRSAYKKLLLLLPTPQNQVSLQGTYG